MVDSLEPRVSLTLLLLEIEAPSVEVNVEVSGARITGSTFFPSLSCEEAKARTFRLRCLNEFSILFISKPK